MRSPRTALPFFWPGSVRCAPASPGRSAPEPRPSPRNSPRRRTPLVAALVVASFGSAACGAVAPEPTTPQSVAEYDVARDSFQKDQLRDALVHVDKALELDEANADAAYLGSVILLMFCARNPASSDCRFEDAERYARKALEADANMRDAKNALGVVLIHLKKPAQAIEVLKPLANDILYASPEKAWGNLGWAYLERGNVNEAIDALQRAIAAQPRFCAGHYRLGLAYEKKGNLEAATGALTKAVETDSPDCKNFQDAFDARARVALKQGLDDQAVADLERCKEISAETTVGQRCAAQLEGTGRSESD